MVGYDPQEQIKILSTGMNFNQLRTIEYLENGDLRIMYMQSMGFGGNGLILHSFPRFRPLDEFIIDFQTRGPSPEMTSEFRILISSLGQHKA